MYIQLRPKHEQFIQAQISSGRYENADDVIAKALKLLKEWEEKTRHKNSYWTCSNRTWRGS